MSLLDTRMVVLVSCAVLSAGFAVPQGSGETEVGTEATEPRRVSDKTNVEARGGGRGEPTAVLEFLSFPTPGGPAPADNCTVGIDQEGLPGNCFTHMSLIWVAEHQLNLCLSALQNVDVAAGSCDQYLGAMESAREAYNQCRSVSSGPTYEWVCPVTDSG